MMVKGAKALEVWCRRATEGYPGVDINNMTTSWKDGLAFCAILHRYRPDRIDFHALDKRDIKGNNALAYRVAEETFGIPSLLDPDDMAKCVAPDRLSILTYVSEYYHRLKSLQPHGSPHIRSIIEEKKAAPTSTTTTATTSVKLSRTSSTSSSGVASLSSCGSSACEMSSSCESSSSSVCDSPPPSAVAAATPAGRNTQGLAASDEEDTPVAASKSSATTAIVKPSSSSIVEKEQQPQQQQQQQPKPQHQIEIDKLTTDQLKEKLQITEDKVQTEADTASATTVVLRRNNGKSTEAQRRATATRRRLVQSMIVESSSGMSSLCSPSPSPPSPAIEKENPFREAMMKFAAMEQKTPKEATEAASSSFNVDKLSPKHKSTPKIFSSKSTETPSPTRDSKSTQTATPSFIASRQAGRDDASTGAGSSFRTVLRSQLSCPAVGGGAAGGREAVRPRAPSSGPTLSYTSTPRPYTSQSMTALNRSSIPNSPQNFKAAAASTAALSSQLVLARAEESRATPTAAHRRPLSMLVTAQQHQQQLHNSSDSFSDYRYQRSQATTLPGTAYTPPMYQHQQQQPMQSSYSSYMSSPAWSPNSSIYMTPSANGSPASSGYSSSSVYSTPMGISPCRNNSNSSINSSRYISGTASNNSSPARFRPMSGGYFGQHHHLPADRLQLHIEGQSSLV